MEKVLEVSTATLAFVTVIMGAGVIATYLTQFLNFSFLNMIISLLFYIFIVLLFVQWIKKEAIE